MTAINSARRQGLRSMATLAFAVALLATAGAAAPAAGEEPLATESTHPLIDVAVDEARILRLNRSPRSIIVGNPLIADAVVEENGIIILVGKNYGTTNLIALDDNGNELANVDLAVRTSGANAVSLFRGTGRVSYNCSPRCETELDVGDEAAHFDALRTQITGKTGLSQGQITAGQ